MAKDHSENFVGKNLDCGTNGGLPENSCSTLEESIDQLERKENVHHWMITNY